MTVTLEYTDEAGTSLDEAFFQDIANRTIEEAALPSLSRKNITLNAIAVTTEKIQELNKTYRGKDAVTDILSFGEYTDENLLEGDEAEVFLGELFFCPEFIGNAAKEDAISMTHEMVYVFSHGVLHLLGFDHSDEMFALQDKVTEILVPLYSPTEH